MSGRNCGTAAGVTCWTPATLRWGHTRDAIAIEALHVLAEMELARERLRGRWRRTAEKDGMLPASELGSEPEQTSVQFVRRMQKLLDWADMTWKPLVERARTAGLDADTLLEASGPKLEAQGEVYRLIEVAGKRLPSTVEAATRQLRLDSIRQELAEIDRRLGDFDHHARSDYAAPTLRKAILARDVAKYAQVHERLVDLHNRLSSREKRGKLLERLKRIAPAWAAAIQRREGLHGAERPPERPPDRLALARAE